MENEPKPDVKKNEKDLFRIRHFSGNYPLQCCTFDITGPALDQKGFAAVHEYLDSAMNTLNALNALNAGLTRGDDGYPKVDLPKPGAVEDAE